MENIFTNCGEWLVQFTDAFYALQAVFLELSMSEIIHTYFPDVDLPEWANSPLIFYLIGTGLITVLIVTIFKWLKDVVI